MPSALRQTAVVLLAFVVLFGGVYPAVVTGVAKFAFPEEAEGSLIRDAEGNVIGSSLVGQSFTKPEYFRGRPSATSYNAAASGGSNLGNGNPALLEAVRARVEALRSADPENAAPVPVDLVTASASGLDPHISIAAARYQAGRVAKARGIPLENVLTLVDKYAQGRLFGIWGEPTVNVLRVNLALDGR